MGQHDEAARGKRWRRGHAATAKHQRRLLTEKGPCPAQAVAESLAALHALEAMGLWPGPRDPIAKRGVEQVRRRWAKIHECARQQARARAAGARCRPRSGTPRPRAPRKPAATAVASTSP